MLRHALAILIVTPIAITNASQAQESPEYLEYDGNRWRVGAQEARVERHLGRDALAIKRGRLWLDDIEFEDGVIEFDTAYKEHQAFIGAGWGIESIGHFEEMYFRAHLNEKPDALQYTPVENGLSAWQIFSDENALAPVTHDFNGWNRAKIVIEGDRADIYFNSDEPVLHIPDLKRPKNTGGINLRSSGPQSEATFFSNIVIRPLRDGEGVIGEPKPEKPLPEGLITKWSVSNPFDEVLVEDTLALSRANVDDRTWQSLDVETNGIANLAKLSGRTQGANTVFVRLNINSDRDQMKELQFGYSDRVRVYLNGKRVYYGIAHWRARDYRFLGTVGFFDSVGLDLREGDNEVLIAVSETFGGWAWAGAMADQDGIEFSD